MRGAVVCFKIEVGIGALRVCDADDGTSTGADDDRECLKSGARSDSDAVVAGSRDDTDDKSAICDIGVTVFVTVVVAMAVVVDVDVADCEGEMSLFLCFDGTKFSADEFSFRLLLEDDDATDSGAGLHGRVRGDEDGECRKEEEALEIVTSVFLSIRVTIFPISVTCFCKCDIREKRC